VVVGTKGWMAPEVKTNRAHVDFDDRTDIWNVGLVIWELMHSSLGEASLEFLRESLSNAWTFNPGEDTFLNEDQWLGTWNGSYPTQLQNLVRQCLKTNLNERPDFLELRTRTSRWLNEQKRIKGNYKRTKDRLPPHLFLDFQDDEFGIGLPITPPSPPRPPHFPGPHPPPRGGGNNKRGRDEDDDDDDQDNPDDDDTLGPSRPPIYQQPQHKHRKADEVQPGPKDNNVDKSQDEETDYANRRTPTVRSNRRNNNGKGKAPATEGKTPVWNGIGKGKAPVR
jgi:serine/threonine protein kinase